MKVILATQEHLDGLVEIFEAYRSFYRKGPNPQEARSFLEQRMSKSESIIYIAMDDQNKLMGFTQLYPSFSSTRLNSIWILNDLYVDQEHRGKGISKALISRAKELVIETKSQALLLETEKDNSIANQLYIATGFQLETNNFYFWEPKK